MHHIGELLVNLHLVTQEELNRCLEIQRNERRRTPIGQILLDEGLLDSSALREALVIHGHLANAERSAGKATERVTAQDSSEDRSGSLLGRLFEVLRTVGGSTLYLASDEVPRTRVHGRVLPFDMSPTPDEALRRELLAALTCEDRAEFSERYAVDTVIAVSDGERSGGASRVRASVFNAERGIAAVLRPVARTIPSPRELGLPGGFHRLLEHRSGLTLLCGPRRSGLSTTVASLIESLNSRGEQKHVLLLTDRIEHSLRSESTLVTQRVVGRDTPSYAHALRDVEQLGIDLLVISDLRDPQVTARALTLAEEGLHVLGCTASRTVNQTLERLLVALPQEPRAQTLERLAVVVRGILCQDLVPNAKGDGMTLIYEHLAFNPSVAQLLREDRIWTPQLVSQVCIAEELTWIDDCLERAVLAGRITPEDALVRASEKLRFANLSV